MSPLFWLCMLCAATSSSRAVSAVTTPEVVTPEEVEHLAEQAAAAPVGRPDFQAAALASFAANLDADPFGVLPLWTGDSHPCGDASNNNKPWPGITCDAPTGWVTALRLPGKALKGTLPTTLAVIKSLRILDLSNNSFYGLLPPRYSNLTSLEQLDLSHNQLTGQLPDTWSSCTALQSLELHHNQLSGAMPASWAGMNLLEVFDASNNKLSSSLPASWGRLSLLSVLDLHNNSLTGSLPPAWSEQRSLLQLNVGDNKIAGQLPEQWAGGMDSLRGVNVTGNSLSGSLPDKWSTMKSLQTLSVGDNQLTGSIPSTWTKLQNLYVINVTKNEGICGNLPSGVSQNVIDGVSTTQLNNMCSWEGDAMPLLDFKAGLRDAGSLLESWKQGTNPCGAAAWRGVLCANGSVLSLDLSGVGLKGPLTEGLMKLSKLSLLQLENNQLTGTLPSWANAPENLTTIDLSRNRLQGTLPGSWSTMTGLQYLDLSYNELQGFLPPLWASLSHLATLLLGSNQALSGTLPTEWASLAALQKVNLDNCNISAGTLPTSWSKLPSVREISLSKNMLMGSVPASLAKLPSLAYLDISGNRQMCGELQELSSNVMVQRTLTGLGAQCQMPSMSATTGVIIGVCASFGGAMLLAGTAYLVMRHRARALQQQPPRAARPAAQNSISGIQTPPRDASTLNLPASPMPTSLPASPRPAPFSLPIMAASGDCMLWSPPPCSPSSSQHRLANVGGPLAATAGDGAGPLGEGVIPLSTAAAQNGSSSHVMLPYRGSSPAPSPAASRLPRPGVAVPTGAASNATSPAQQQDTSFNGTASPSPLNAMRNSTGSGRVTPPFNAGLSASDNVLNSPRSSTPAAAAAAGALTSAMSALSHGHPLLRQGLSQPPSPHPRPSSVPSSPRAAGTWGSAVKIHDHGPTDGSNAGSPVLVAPGSGSSSLAYLNARVTQLRLAEAAAGAGSPSRSGQQLLEGFAGSIADSSSTGGVSSRSSPCPAGDDVGVASPRRMAALLAAGGAGRDGATEIAAEAGETGLAEAGAVV